MGGVDVQRLDKLDPRSAWENEARDFTPWLAQEENFSILAETLHLVEAEVEATEHAIGDFSADILARDFEGYVLVENQLEKTDHTHLGQILTYLGGLDALEDPVKIVWIATKVRDEHRAAVDWLNSHTPERFSFFAVELELYRIGDSPAAPYFHVAARPNEWSRHVSARARSIADAPQTDTQRKFRDYWAEFAEHANATEPNAISQTPSKRPYWKFSGGRAGFSIDLTAKTRDRSVAAVLWCNSDEDKLVFDHLYAQRASIEAEFGEQLIWNRISDKKAWAVEALLPDVDPLDAERRVEFFDWMWARLNTFRRVLVPRIRALDIDALADAAGDTR